MFLVSAIVYGALHVMIHITQGKLEPSVLPTRFPFMDSAIGIARHKVNYLVHLRYVLPPPHRICTLQLTLHQSAVQASHLYSAHALPEDLRRQYATPYPGCTEQSQPFYFRSYAPGLWDAL